MEFRRSEKGVTPVIAVILLLMMTVAAAGAAYLWITKISNTMRSNAERSVSEGFTSGSIAIENNGPCDVEELLGEVPEDLYDSDNGILYSMDDNTRAVLKSDYLCIYAKNQGDHVLRLSDLNLVQISYEVPGKPGNRPITGTKIGVIFPKEKIWCTLADLSDGKCKNKNRLEAKEPLVFAFLGTFKDANGDKYNFTYDNAYDQRIILHLNLPSGQRQDWQVSS